MLDRNGLRPARYTLTTDDIFILASETGVADIPAEKVARKGRLRPGEMIYCDLVNHRLVSDAETKNEMARAHALPPLGGTKQDFRPLPVRLCLRLRGNAGPGGSSAPVRLHAGGCGTHPPPDDDEGRGTPRLHGERRAAGRSLRKGAAPVQLLQAIVRAGDQPAHRPHPGGTRHEPDHVHRQPSQHSGGNAGARPAHQDGAPRHYGRGAQPPLQHPGSRLPLPPLSLQFPEGGDGKVCGRRWTAWRNPPWGWSGPACASWC